MKVNEIKETREVIIRTEYIAKDGTVFKDREECEKYENSCECTLMAMYQSLVKGTFSEFELLDAGGDEYLYDIVEIKDVNDLEIVNKLFKFNCEKAKLVNASYIGKEILVCHDAWEFKVGEYFTTIEDIVKGIRERYEIFSKERKAN